jgi:predicted CoA-substrate-specific enzyme activase
MTLPKDSSYVIGLDVGSVTVKGIVSGPQSDRIVWRDYQRHETRQPEMVLEFLERMESEAGIAPGDARVFITGSGGSSLAALIGAKFVQEVNAVALAVEKLHPEVHSVIELGGQDAKIITFQEEANGGGKKKTLSMNDRCAAGTGAAIDKIVAKLKIPGSQLCEQGYHGIRIHRVAGRCGVFAETDINSLQKQGIPADQLLASLFEAIVLQNLTVLARGNTLHPHVLLLGGPNAFLRGMREAWEHNIPLLWKERQVRLPQGARAADCIKVPENALYFAAMGAVEFGRRESAEAGRYSGTESLKHYLREGRQKDKCRSAIPPLLASAEELSQFEREYARPPFVPAKFQRGATVRGFIGLDGGSTSTKAVLVSEGGELLSKAYQLSQGNPIQDTKELFESLRLQVEGQGARLNVLGVATTGYAKDILREVLHADVALAETVAHARSALQFCQDPHCIVDVGGQDIKIIVLENGRIKDFRLNTQCSAGNGYFLQSAAEGFGVPVAEYARVAFSAQAMPVFGYGCAVFLQSDIVNFQRQGWRPEEILAGLAAVLPKNIFLYVAHVANVSSLGSRFVLQGGTQYNLAAVKAEVDFLRANFEASGRELKILVHPHCGEAGAIGAALEAVHMWQGGRRTRFIGLEAVRNIAYRTTRSEETRCHFCKNACLRTFVDVYTGNSETWKPPSFPSKVPLQAGEQRLIVASCEKGSVEDVGAMREIKAGLDAKRAANPNLVDLASREVWKSPAAPLVADSLPGSTWRGSVRERIALMNNRASLRIGIPRVLNMYAYAPLFSAYLESLGVQPENIVYSDFTTDEMYRSGSSRGSIDPCFPSKITIAHFHNLIYTKHCRQPLQAIFLPMFDVLCSPLVRTRACNACPTVAVTPETVRAAYTKEIDVFARNGIRYLHPLVNLSDRKLFARQMFRCWAPLLGLSEEENERAAGAGYAAWQEYESAIRKRAREALDLLERENRLGVVMLGRPYHHDPGLNHGIFDEFQKLGYPVFSQSTLPLDEDLLERLFGEEVRAGRISHPLDISDAWKTATAASSNLKIWAAKFTARHPNLVAVEISSFKCGHDAPIYSVVERIIAQSRTPYFCFKDLDENKPAASIKLRVETIDYFLRQYRQEMAREREARTQIDRQLSEFESRLRAHLPVQIAGTSPARSRISSSGRL